jgi:hypothetical protein
VKGDVDWDVVMVWGLAYCRLNSQLSADETVGNWDTYSTRSTIFPLRCLRVASGRAIPGHLEERHEYMKQNILGEWSVLTLDLALCILYSQRAIHCNHI